MAATFNPGFDDIGIPEPVKRKTTGQMGVWAFLKLRKALKRKPWRDPSLEVCSFDDVAWKMKSSFLVVQFGKVGRKQLNEKKCLDKGLIEFG